ncbi:hypothetical protein D3C76_1450470 [compost metagenome]
MLIRGVAQQDHELVTAQPRRQCTVGQDRTNHVAQRDQQSIARRMAVQVVDLFEIVDIDQQQGAGARWRDVFEQTRCPYFEGAAVVQGGQRIARGQPGDALFAPVAFGTGHGQGNQHDRHRALDQ